MSKYLMTVRLEGPATVSAAAKALGLSPSQIDAGYGVVEVDPDSKLFAVQVERSENDSMPDFSPGTNESFQGPFSNPRIAPFGPAFPISTKLP
jgi:hypothetical protein